MSKKQKTKWPTVSNRKNIINLYCWNIREIKNNRVVCGIADGFMAIVTRADKISVIKFKRRKNYHRNKGHRQHETVLKITAISAKAAAKKAAPKAEASEDAAEE